MSSSAPLHSSVMPMPDHPSACVRHPQILLDKKCLAGQLRNSTTAVTNNSRGHHLEVTFKAVDPPAISLCLVSCVDQTGDRLLGQPRIVGVAGGFVLLAICFSDSVYNLCQFVDYFVYKAGPDFASLHLLARPYPSSFSLNLAAILPAGDNSKDFAVIFPHVEYFSLECRKHYTLHIYRSDVNAWHSQVAYISEDNETSNAKYRLLIHNAMSVAYAEKGIIAWIDLWWGILLCNVLDKKPIIRFVPLPVPEPCDPSEFCLLHQDLNPRPHRHVTILNDLIKFVEVDFHVEDVFNMKRENDYGWRAKTWTRSLYSNVWCDGLMFDTSEISCTDSSLSNILPDMFDEENNLTWNKLMSAGPTLSLHDDNIIYIMAKESRCHRIAYVLAVNIKSLKLESGAQCSAEKMLGFEPTYDSCVLFSSFGTTSELVKEFETKGTMFETKEGPALLVVSKRLRMLRKKQNRIAQMEESVAAGKMLNQEQKEVMHSKPVIAALIDELERLRMPLSTALTKELSTAPGPAASRSSSFGSDLSIQDLLALIYFGSLFDVKSPNEFTATMVAHEHERSSCITHGYVWDDTMDLLTENDLDAVSAVAALAAARPVSAVGVSHHDALQACAHHARLWLARADVPIHPGSSVTYAAVRSKLDRIMTSDYYTAPAVGGNHGAEGLQAQMSMTVSPEALSLKENLAAEFHKEDEEDPSHATEIFNDHQCNAADVQNVDDNAPVNTREEYPVAEAEQEKLDVEEQDQRYGEPKERQFQHSRRSYQNQRGCDRGRRGAYPNGCSGRGGGHGVGNGYHNGRGGGGGYQGGGGGGHGMGSRYQNGRGGGGGYQGGGGGYQEGGRGMGSRYQSGRGGGGGYQGGGGGYQNCRGGGGGYQGGGGGYQNGRGGGGGGGWYYNNEDGYCQPRNLNNRGRCAGRWPHVHRED